MHQHGTLSWYWFLASPTSRVPSPHVLLLSIPLTILRQLRYGSSSGHFVPGTFDLRTAPALTLTLKVRVKTRRPR